MVALDDAGVIALVEVVSLLRFRLTDRCSFTSFTDIILIAVWTLSDAGLVHRVPLLTAVARLADEVFSLDRGGVWAVVAAGVGNGVEELANVAGRTDTVGGILSVWTGIDAGHVHRVIQLLG